MDKSSQKPNKISAFIMMLVAVLMALFLLPTTILLCVGMAPSIVAAHTGPRKTRKSRTLTVGSFNIVGCMPFLLDSWIKGHNVSESINIVVNPGNLIVMIGMAGFGYLFYQTVSSFIQSFYITKNDRRRKVIKKQQNALVERWGEDIKE